VERRHGGGVIERIRVREIENQISLGKGSVRVAVNEATPAYDVRSDLLVDHRDIARGRAPEIGYCRKNFVLNVDQIARVFRDITGVSDHDGSRLADVSCPIPGARRDTDR